MNNAEHRKKTIPWNRGERGMTIVELLVAMTISAILVTLAFQFLSSQVYSLTENRQIAEMQQELRWAMKFLTDHVKLAGNGVPTTTGWAVIEAVNGANGAPDSLSIMGTFRSVNITTTQPWGNAGSQEMLDDTSEIEIGDLAVISDGTYSEIFMITDKTDLHVWHDEYLPWNDDKKLDHRYAEGSNLTIIGYYQFFVDTDDQGRTNLMLRHQAYPAQILLGDVDDFQVRFQMKSGAWQDEVTVDEIYDIRVVEITIRAKTPEPVRNYTDPAYGDSYKRVEMKSNIIPQNIVVKG
ncbi:prepilin-type N-terminal cleavage/methylation domain-containing protein [bacterium]|nr:prepilin-type N-terminal cleavage/methylation domain-containing protein [bacterium]